MAIRRPSSGRMPCVRLFWKTSSGRESCRCESGIGSRSTSDGEGAPAEADVERTVDRLDGEALDLDEHGPSVSHRSTSKVAKPLRLRRSGVHAGAATTRRGSDAEDAGCGGSPPEPTAARRCSPSIRLMAKPVPRSTTAGVERDVFEIARELLGELEPGERRDLAALDALDDVPARTEAQVVLLVGPGDVAGRAGLLGGADVDVAAPGWAPAGAGAASAVDRQPARPSVGSSSAVGSARCDRARAPPSGNRRPSASAPSARRGPPASGAASGRRNVQVAQLEGLVDPELGRAPLAPAPGSPAPGRSASPAAVRCSSSHHVVRGGPA